MTDEAAIVEGFVSVRAVFKSGSRPIHRITVRRDKWDKGVAWLERSATAAGIAVQRADADAIDALVRRLRHRLAEVDPDQEYIVTVRGYGFRLDVGKG